VRYYTSIEAGTPTPLARDAGRPGGSDGGFYNAVTRRIAAPLTSEQANERIKNLAMAWPVLEITPLIAIEAARGASQHQMRIWDAQIWATARLNQIPVVLSEDFSDGAVIEGIRIVNPFTVSFQARDWVR